MEKAWDESFELTRPLAEADLALLGTWRYPPPYQLYSPRLAADDRAEFLGGAYHAVTNRQGELTGYFCYGVPAQVPAGHTVGGYDDPDLLDIGLGLRPDMTGRGLGPGFLERGISLARTLHRPLGLRLTVAAFNQRAITVYERAGFSESLRFPAPTPMGIQSFVIMLTSKESDSTRRGKR
jgi:[ribosomal protein S18]-alanine N-acetyltransferase